MMVGTQNPLPWLWWVNSNPSFVCNQTKKKCWTLSLSAVLPEAAGSQDPQVFHTHQPLLNTPYCPPTKPDQCCSCCFPPLQIRFEGHCEMSLLFFASQHPAIIQSRCHLNVWGSNLNSVLFIVIRFLTLGLTQCQFSGLYSPHWASVKNRYSVASCVSHPCCL